MTFYSFPRDFGERAEPINLIPVPAPLRRAPGDDGTRQVGPVFNERPMPWMTELNRWAFAPVRPCHFPDLRPRVERRMRELIASYYNRPSYLPLPAPLSNELIDDAAAMRFPPGTRTVRIPVIGPLTARVMDEDAPIDEMPVRTLEATPRQVIEAERLARTSGMPLDWVLERVLGIEGPEPVWADRAREDMAAHIGAVMGRAMAEIVDRRMATALLWGTPVFSLDDEGMREWLSRMGIELPDGSTGARYLTGQTLLGGAKTLRQRCFARLVNWCNAETGELILAHAGKRMVKPLGSKLPNMMAACRRDPGARKALSALPISRAPYTLAGDPEVVEALQDLADIVAWEARSAFTERYYPGVADVDPLTDGQVDAVMAGMQREVNREHRGKQVPYYGMLPRARQVALAERRRHWFGVFGITPKSWKKRTWSLWKVSTAAFPDGYKKYDG